MHRKNQAEIDAISNPLLPFPEFFTISHCICEESIYYRGMESRDSNYISGCSLTNSCRLFNFYLILNELLMPNLCFSLQIQEFVGYPKSIINVNKTRYFPLNRIYRPQVSDTTLNMNQGPVCTGPET